MRNVIAMILAGGVGSRLSILAERRAKPAVPFGGLYRLIDFTVSNVMISNIPYVGILTQYRPYSLMDHLSIGESWGFNGQDRVLKILPPFSGKAEIDWYSGTAEAVFQNMGYINRFDVDYVIILSGDHIYHMDYSEMIQFHIDSGADVTLATQQVPMEETYRFGITVCDDNDQVIEFQEKPEKARSNLASLGIYVFSRNILHEKLHALRVHGQGFDFGKHVIPQMIEKNRVFSYEYTGYWQDVGTIKAYMEANMDVLDPHSGIDFRKWNVRTNLSSKDLLKKIPARIHKDAAIVNSLISMGDEIDGMIDHSILSPQVKIGEGSRVEHSIIMNDAQIGRNCIITNAILDKECVIGDGAVIGTGENIPNKQIPHILDSGITLIGKKAQIPHGTRIGKNCLIRPDCAEELFNSQNLESGESV